MHTHMMEFGLGTPKYMAKISVRGVVLQENTYQTLVIRLLLEGSQSELVDVLNDEIL